MLNAIEKFRQSDSGKTTFYVLIGIAIALFTMVLIKPIKLTVLSGNGNHNHIKGKFESKDKTR